MKNGSKVGTDFHSTSGSKISFDAISSMCGSKIGFSVYYVTNILFIRGIDLFKMSKVRKFDYSKNLIKKILRHTIFP